MDVDEQTSGGAQSGGMHNAKPARTEIRAAEFAQLRLLSSRGSDSNRRTYGRLSS